ncbi:restriction endonuclease subunit S [Xanthomonas campestris pv. passiflorae]|uniref:restriction endonuclease subunit S n=1 Tax=Xanthomonas campestris TaxID=339 RepID=UPI0024205641|nr:restriction endonuclease subunit S [Xanthomonas campestris]MBV6812359.1 restriction endonuclease subunit S [Xanthomonas campestris pv. passiflorae]
MSDTPNIDIRPDHWQIVRDILHKHVPHYEVWAFGSRAKWLAKQYSDLDLAIITDQPLSLAVSAALADDFSESDLPWKVDIVDWAATSEAFRQIIERDRVVVQKSRSGPGMVSEWRDTTWGEEISLEYGKAIRGYDEVRGKYRVFGSNGAIGWTENALAEGPGVILGRKGAYRGVRFWREPFWVIDTAYYVVPKKKLDMRWLYYAIKQHKLGEIDDGSPIPSTTRAAVYVRELTVPSLKEQGEISYVLGVLDDKIELNRRMNQTLEAMVHALFKSWFVDFDGVAPEDMQESELGFIPKGWQVIAFGDVAQQVKGTVNPMTSPEETFTHYSLPAFDVAQLPVREVGEAIKSNKTPVPNECVLVSKLNPRIPRIWLIGGAGHNAVCSTEFIVWMPKKPANSAFVYVLASSSEFNSALRQLVTGTSNSHQRVKPEQLANIRVIAVNDEAISKFSAQSKPLMEKLLHHRLQSQQLAQLRDTLLPKLISGEVRIKDAERLAETA